MFCSIPPSFLTCNKTWGSHLYQPDRTPPRPLCQLHAHEQRPSFLWRSYLLASICVSFINDPSSYSNASDFDSFSSSIANASHNFASPCDSSSTDIEVSLSLSPSSSSIAFLHRFPLFPVSLTSCLCHFPLCTCSSTTSFCNDLRWLDSSTLFFFFSLTSRAYCPSSPTPPCDAPSLISSSTKSCPNCFDLPAFTPTKSSYKNYVSD